MFKSSISWFSLDGRILALRRLPQSQTQWIYFFCVSVSFIKWRTCMYILLQKNILMSWRKKIQKEKCFERDNKKGIRVKNDSFQLSVKTRLNQETLEQVHCEKENRKSLYTKDKRKWKTYFSLIFWSIYLFSNKGGHYLLHFLVIFSSF